MEKVENHFTGVKEIARLANVSIGTVDRVIHDRVGVSPKTRELIKRIINDINYQPNLLGRRLASNKVTQFATLIPKVSKITSFWEAPLKGIERAESEIQPYNINVEKFFFDQNDKNSFKKEAAKILKKDFEGILMVPGFIEESISFTNKCKKLYIPYVFIDSDIPDQPSLCFIGPDLLQSGYLAANLISYLVGKKDRIAIINISTEMENFHHLLRKEEGFRKYFKEHKISNKIEKVDIRKISYGAIKKEIGELLEKFGDIKVLFVTNSKVSMVAHYLKESNKDILLVGYDFLEENIKYLKNEIINFLICQKPGEQAYKGLMALYKNCVLKLPVEENIFMPINIIMKSNYEFYTN